MKSIKNMAIVGVVLVAAVVTIILKRDKAPDGPSSGDVSAPGSAVTAAFAEQGERIPRLVDLGAGKCMACKMMTPVLEDLKKTYVGKMDVQFIDVWEDAAAGKEYGITIIPTQIFFDSAGKELFRHEGFISREDIMAKWKELGVTFGEVSAPPHQTGQGKADE